MKPPANPRRGSLLFPFQKNKIWCSILAKQSRSTALCKLRWVSQWEACSESVMDTPQTHLSQDSDKWNRIDFASPWAKCPPIGHAPPSQNPILCGLLQLPLELGRVTNSFGSRLQCSRRETVGFGVNRLTHLFILHHEAQTKAFSHFNNTCAFTLLSGGPQVGEIPQHLN